AEHAQSIGHEPLQIKRRLHGVTHHRLSHPTCDLFLMKLISGLAIVSQMGTQRNLPQAAI
ncbi:hypothetical protein, partial [Elstera litoralis]|uniref:hypothetical protein n=1 Tax=Elstera litoralis TaxID=552518 RepID=UPI001E34E659